MQEYYHSSDTLIFVGVQKKENLKGIEQKTIKTYYTFMNMIEAYFRKYQFITIVKKFKLFQSG